jgi:hypothetical protein
MLILIGNINDFSYAVEVQSWGRELVGSFYVMIDRYTKTNLHIAKMFGFSWSIILWCLYHWDGTYSFSLYKVEQNNYILISM